VVTDALRSAVLGNTRDLSVDGLFLVSESRLPLGATVPLCLQIDDGEEIRVQAEVLRWHAEGMGMRFSEVSREDRKRLRWYIAGMTSIDRQRDTAQRLHDPSTRTTEPLRDAGAIEGRLRAAMSGSVDVRAIPSERPVMDEGRFSVVDRDGLTMSTTTASRLVAGESVLVLLTLKYVSYSFESAVLEVDGRRVRLSMPDSVVFSERRETNRTVAPDEARLRVGAPWDSSEVLEFRVADLAPTGVGVLAPASMGTFFPGTPLPGAELDLGGSVEKLQNAVVRNVRRLELPNGDTVYRLGISCGTLRQAVVEDRFDGRVEAPRGLFAKLSTALARARDGLTLVWHTRVKARVVPAGDGGPGDGVRSVSFKGERGLTIRGLMNLAFDEEAVPECPVVIIVPGFAGRKEQTSLMANVIADHWRRAHRQIAVIRLDGTNNLGESDTAPGCDVDGKRNLNYTISGASVDLLECLAWLRRGEVVRATDVSVVSVSFSSVGVRHALATGRAPEVRRWVSWMGAADARDAVLNVSGHFDVYKAAEAAEAAGVAMGQVTLTGCVVDARKFYDDLVETRIGTLEDSRREMADIGADILWMRGEYDAWMDPQRIADVMAVPSAGSRELLSGASGHMPQTGPEAVRQFAAITEWLEGRIEGRSTPVKPPSLGWLGAMAQLEWRRVRREMRVDAADWWADYLLDDRGPGFDILQYSPAYTELMDVQARLLDATGKRVLEIGAGTGNMTARILAMEPESLFVTDLVPEAIERISARFADDSRVDTAVMDVEGSPWLALDRYRRGELTGWRELFRRLPGMPLDMIERLVRADATAVHSMLSGFDVDIAHLGLPRGRNDEATRALLAELTAAARHARVTALGATGSELDAEASFVLLQMGSISTRRGLNFADQTFDRVMMSLVLSYLQTPGDVLAEVRRVLKPGGQFVMSTLRRDADSSKIFLDLITRLENAPEAEVGSGERREQLVSSARRFLDRASDLFRLEEEGVYKFWDSTEFEKLARLHGFTDCRVSESFGQPAQAIVLTCTRVE
jgi:ubiquinone/menaquinone biosynthesis C-methylase UbiE/c-di-GMP-binding flagellar brake protein YcgR